MQYRVKQLKSASGQGVNIIVQKRSISVLFLLTILFIIMRIAGIIDWHWVWLISPLWIPWAILISGILGVVVIFLVGFGILLAGAWCIDEYNRMKRDKAAAKREKEI